MTKRSAVDRRSGFDRRQAHDLEYFRLGGIERRTVHDRRQLLERRADWARISQWSSVKRPRVVYV